MARTGLRIEINPFFGFTVKTATAVKEDKTGSFNMICPGSVIGRPDTDEKHDHAPAGVNMRFVCPVCGNDDRTTFKQGKKQDDGTVLMFEDDAVAEAKDADEDSKKLLRVSAHPLDQVETRALFSGKAYFLRPEASNEKPYKLFAKLIEDNPDKAFLTTYTYTKVSKLYRFMVFDGCLALAPLCWPEDLAETPDVPQVDISEGEQAQGQTLIDMLLDDFRPEEFRDNRRVAIQQLMDAATGVEGAVVEATGKAPKATVDMSGALQAALAAARAAKGLPTQEATGKAASKKAAVKKPAAKAS